YLNKGPCSEPRTIPGRTVEASQPCKFTFINKSGAVITSERYDDAMDFSEGLAPVRVGSNWGYIDKKGGMAIKPEFDDAFPFYDELALVRRSGLYGYIDHTGAILIAPQYKQAGNFSDGLAAVGGRNGEEGDEEYYYIN